MGLCDATTFTTVKKSDIFQVVFLGSLCIRVSGLKMMFRKYMLPTHSFKLQKKITRRICGWFSLFSMQNKVSFIDKKKLTRKRDSKTP